MESTKLSKLLVLAMLALSSSPLALACECNSRSPSTPSTGTPVVTVPHVKVPKVKEPKVTLPPIVSNPPVSLPPVLGGGSPVTVPPVTLPPISVAPVIGGGSPPYSTPPVRHGGRKACPPPPSPPTPTPSPSPPTPTPSPPSPSSDTCPIDALKLGACVDLLGNEVHIGDANVQCCPLVKGIAGLSAAACLCTTIKAKLLDLTVYVPIALKLLVNCGCAVPPGYTCA